MRAPGGSVARLYSDPDARRAIGRVIGALGASTAVAGLVLWGMTFSASAKPGAGSETGHRTISTHSSAVTTPSPLTTPTPGPAGPNATDATIFGTTTWRLKFHPLFSGTSLNHSDWATCYPWADRPTGCTNFGHSEFQWYLPGQDRVSNGLLYLVAQRKRTIGNSVARVNAVLKPSGRPLADFTPGKYFL